MHDRFHIEQDLSEYLGREIYVDSITNHLKAFRKKAGDDIKLYDGLGSVFLANIIEISKKRTKLRLASKKTYEEPKIKIYLFLPIISSNLMDQLVARVCELEISEIFPVITERSINLRGEKEINNKLIKWDKISKGACILAGKNFSTVINKPIILEDAFKLSNSFGIKLIASPDAKMFLKDYLFKAGFQLSTESALKVKSIGLFIGPEGDFSNRELKLFEEYGILPVRLSNHIMSTFTASIFFASNLICIVSSNYVS